MKPIVALVFLGLLALAPSVSAGYISQSSSAFGWSQRVQFGEHVQDIPPAVVSTGSGLCVVSQLKAGGIVVNCRADGLWVGWESLGGSMNGSAAAASDGEDIYVAIRGMDDAVWSIQRVAGVWSSWESWGGRTYSDPVIAKTSGGVVIAVKGADGKLWVNRKNGTGLLEGWRQAGDLVIKGNLSISEEDDVAAVAARDGGDSVYVIEMNASGSWGAWINTGGQGITDPSIFVAGGVIHASVVGLDGSLWYARKNGSWSVWQSLGGNLSKKPVISADAEGRVFAASWNARTVYFRILENGVWSAWFSSPGVSTEYNAAVYGMEYAVFMTSVDEHL